MADAIVTKALWGNTAHGEPVETFTIDNGEIAVRITSFGARIVNIEVPDRDGNKADVVLGFNSLEEYEADKRYLGAIVGRYGNRIAKGKFSIGKENFTVPANHNANALHGGPKGFDKKVWKGREIPNGVEMTLVSPDGEMGFPGELTVGVHYTVQGSALRIVYRATTTQSTVINLTNHSYFNLAGEGNGTILDQMLTIHADRYTQINAELIPNGQLASVAETPFEFRKAVTIGSRIDSADEQLKFAGGYDHNWVLQPPQQDLPWAAKAYDPVSGRSVTVTTTQPGIQFYSGNFLDGTSTGKSGVKYQKHSGFCLETQHFPDSPNHPEFPSTLLRPGETFHSETVFAFGTQQ